MAWQLTVVDKDMSLTQTQAKALVAALKAAQWPEFDTYLDWLGDEKDLVNHFAEVDFIDDFMEHQDYLNDATMQQALVNVGARGHVTFADFEGDSRGSAWTHTFSEAGYTYTVGKAKQLVDGKMPEKTAKSRAAKVSVLATHPHDAFVGRTFVVTGTLSNMTRSEAEAHIMAMGGKPAGTPTKNTLALIVGTDAGSKLAKAKSLGIQVWGEPKFLQYIAESGRA
jgi:NAD-dependent DNA ligase